MLVHDADLAQPALERGCVDLVVGGHVHVQDRADRVEAAGRAGRLQLHDRHDRRRGVRHRDRVASRAATRWSRSSPTATAARSGIQPVTLQTNGQYVVSSYVPLSYEPLEGRGVHLAEPAGSRTVAAARARTRVAGREHRRRTPAAERGGRGPPRADPRDRHQGARAAGGGGRGAGGVPRRRPTGCSASPACSACRSRRSTAAAASRTRSTSRWSRRSPPRGRASPSAPASTASPPTSSRPTPPPSSRPSGCRGCSAATGWAPTASPSRRPAPTSARSGPARSARAPRPTATTSSTAPSSGSATAPAPTTTSSSPAPATTRGAACPRSS